MGEIMSTLYKHYKSKAVYEFISEGKLESTAENVAIYKRLYNEQIWVRPMSEFFGRVTLEDGTIVERYERVKDENM